MKLHYMPESPPCAAVLMLLDHLNIEFQRHYVDLSKGEQFKADFLKINPLNTIPVLEEDGEIFYESRAILTYLINRYASTEQKTLYPENPLKRAEVDTLLFFDIGRLYSAQSAHLGPLLQGQRPNEEHEKPYKKFLTFLDKQLQNRVYLTGSSMTLADISITASLIFGKAARFDYSSYPNLLKWMQTMESWQSYKNIVPSALGNFTGYVDLKRPQN